MNQEKYKNRNKKRKNIRVKKRETLTSREPYDQTNT